MTSNSIAERLDRLEAGLARIEQLLHELRTLTGTAPAPPHLRLVHSSSRTPASE